jgi:HEAT repeat protein
MKTEFLIGKIRFSVSRPAGLFLCLMAGLLLPTRTHADGCFVAPPFVWNKHKDINEPTQKAILVYDAGQEDLLLQVKYAGPVAQFGWLVPVPGLPTVKKGSMECFYELSRYTQEHWEPRVPPAGMRQSASRSAGDESKPEPVKVIEIKTVGDYEVAVLSARDAGSLENWLKANQFAFPKDKEAVIDAYIQQQWYFVAVKIDLNKAGGFQVVSGPPRQAAAGKSSVKEKLASGELQPLWLRFASKQCVFPLKISSVNGTPSEVQVYVLSPEPLVEKGMFEKKFPEVRRLTLEHSAKRMQAYQRTQEIGRQVRMHAHPEEGNILLPVETNIPLNVILRTSVPYEALLPYGAVTEKDLPECSRQMPQLKGKTWWLTKQTWTFKPEEMRDLVFQPAAAAFAEDLAGEEGYYVAQNLARLGTNAVPALVTALQSTNPVVRIHAVSALDDSMGGSPLLQDSRVLDCLPALFRDPEPEVRMQAANAAGSSRNPKFEEALINLLRDPDEGVRHAAMFAVKRNYYGKSPSLPVLQKLLKDENLEVRAAALEALGISRTPIPREDILPLLSVTNMRVVSIALSRLGQDGVSLDELEPLFHNRLMMARLAGLAFVERLGNNQEAIELILPLLRDPEQPVRGHAWKLLETLTGQTIPQDQPERWEQWWTENKPALMLAEYTKAIAQDPKDGRAYHNRGCLYYNAHKFPEALADFRKARELGSDARDYSCFRLWLLQARSGEKDAATRELAACLEQRPAGKPDDWPSKIGRFLAGQMTEADLFKAAADPNAQTAREQHCEAYFYAGSKRLIEGDQTTAADYFKQCVATDVKKFEEYSSAVAELKFLKAAPTK